MKLLKELKKPILLITYAAVLFFVFANLAPLGGFFNFLSKVAMALIYGLAIAFILNIIMKLFENHVLRRAFEKFKTPHKMKRAICIILTLLTGLTFIFIVVMVIFPQLISSIMGLLNNMPGYLEEVNKFITSFSAKYEIVGNFLSQIKFNMGEIISASSKFLSVALPNIANFTFGFTNGVVNVVVGLIFAVYLLYYKEKMIAMTKKLLFAFGNFKYAKKLIDLFSEANVMFSKFIGGQMTEALILGTLCFIGMSIFRFPYALLVSVLICVTALIPILGAYIGTIPSALIIFLVDPMQALWFVIFILILQQLENNLIYPKVVGKSIGLSGLWVLVAITVGGGLFGIIGILLGVPSVALLYTIIRRVTYRRLTEREISPEEIK